MSHPFALGVASFDPAADSVLLWTGVDEASTEVGWELTADEACTEVVASGTAAAGPAGTVTVEATGLEPGTHYWYRFTARGVTSPIGRTRTLPAEGVERTRIGITCCARFSQSRFAVYRGLADADLDAVLHLGDYIYEDCKTGIEGRDPEPLRDVVTLDEYRTRHRQYRRDPDLQALHARHPMVVVCDDHDFADNASRDGAKSHDPDEQGPWDERRIAALTAHQEFVPKRLADPDDPSSCWRRLPFGDLVALVCTETRVHGRDAQAGLPGAAPATDPDRSLLGADQRRWLLDAVRDRSTGWVVMASGTVVSELEIKAPEILDGVLPEKYAVVEGRAVNTDQWDGYRAERAALVGALRERGGSAIVVSGDIHSAWAIDGPLGGDGRPVAVELVCPPAATTPLGQLATGSGAILAREIPRLLPRVRWIDADHHGYLVLDVTLDEVRATWWWVDPAAEEVHPELGRTWLVPAGSPPSLVDGDEGQPAAVLAWSTDDTKRKRPWIRRAVGALIGAGAVGALVHRQRGRSDG